MHYGNWTPWHTELSQWVLYAAAIVIGVELVVGFMIRVFR